MTEYPPAMSATGVSCARATFAKSVRVRAAIIRFFIRGSPFFNLIFQSGFRGPSFQKLWAHPDSHRSQEWRLQSVRKCRELSGLSQSMVVQGMDISLHSSWLHCAKNLKGASWVPFFSL